MDKVLQPWETEADTVTTQKATSDKLLETSQIYTD